jgi:nucleoside-diphosphate-sugar epimerase
VKAQRVLVTGGAGRLGRSVLAGLAERGHQPVSVDVAGSPGSFPADLTDPGEAYAVMARYRPDAVVHLAAIAVPFSRPEATIHRINTALAFCTLQAAVDLGVPRIVVASSPTVYGYGNPAGWTPDRLPLDEDSPVRPWHAYSLSKLAAEQTAAMFAARRGAEVHLSVIRPCFVVAPEDWDGAPTQNGHTIRDRLDRPELAAHSLFNYVDARDVADLVAALLDPPDGVASGEVFLASAADALAREPLADLVPRHHPGIAAAAAGLTGTRPAFSAEKARRLLGWAPRRSWRTELA